MSRPVSACGRSPVTEITSSDQRYTTSSHYIDQWAGSLNESFTCSCGCDLPVLLGMGIKHSKKAEKKDGSKKKISRFLSGDNNHHNHHFGCNGRTVQPVPPKNYDVNRVLHINEARLNPDSLRITKFKAGIDKKLTSIDERSPGVLKYKTPHFRATATVEVPALGDGAAVQIGWIQTCTHMQFLNTYGEHGLTSWEFPEIISGKYSMVSDADGKMYPWYGARQEVSTVNGPSPRQTITVEMNDNFFPQVTWCIPTDTYDRKPRLTQIHRSQKFYTFLAMKNLVTTEVHVLRAITWSMELTIGVDPFKPLGHRAWLVGPREQSSPRLIDIIHPLPDYALKPPNANRSQSLIWRPKYGEAKLVVPPLESTIDINKYMNATRGIGQKFQALLPES